MFTSLYDLVPLVRFNSIEYTLKTPFAFSMCATEGWGTVVREGLSSIYGRDELVNLPATLLIHKSFSFAGVYLCVLRENMFCINPLVVFKNL